MKPGDVVVYEAHKDAPLEIGIVTLVVDEAMARVLFLGDATSKLTPISRLSLAAPPTRLSDWESMQAAAERSW